MHGCAVELRGGSVVADGGLVAGESMKVPPEGTDVDERKHVG